MACTRNQEKSDAAVRFAVLWRACGARGGRQESEFFEDPEAAERFRDMVNGHGRQWPPGWIRSQGFVSNLRSPDEMFEQNLSPWFKQAAVDAEPALRATNPCAHTRLPRLDGDEVEEVEEVEDEMVFIEREEWDQLHECMAEDAMDIAETFAETGGRVGEVTALGPDELLFTGLEGGRCDAGRFRRSGSARIPGLVGFGAVCQ